MDPSQHRERRERRGQRQSAGAAARDLEALGSFDDLEVRTLDAPEYPVLRGVWMTVYPWLALLLLYLVELPGQRNWFTAVHVSA